MPGVWPQRRYDGGRTGYNPDAAGVPSGIDERLSFELPSGYDETVTVDTVVVAPDEYVAADTDTVTAYSRTDGTRNWSRGFDYLNGGPVLDGRWLVVGSHDRMHGVERADDRIEWVKPLTWQAYGVVSDTVVHDGRVYVGGCGGSENEEGSLAVLDPSSGSVEHSCGMSGVGEVFVDDGHVLCNWHAFFSGGVEAFDRVLDSSHSLADVTDGPGPGGGPWWTPRLVANGYVYGATTDAEELVAYDIEDGSERWRRRTEDGCRVRPVVVRDVLYVWGDSGLIARNSHTGDVLWQCPAARQARTDFSDDADESMVAALSSLVLGGDRPMAVDPDTGDVLWTHDDPFTVHALVDDELVASRGEEVLVFRDSDSSGTQVYGAVCPACGADLDGRGDPAFCPGCGASLDG